MSTLNNVVSSVAYSVLSMLQFAMLVRAIMSWIPSLHGSPLQGVLYQITEPIIAPFRSILQGIPALRSMPIDFSFLAAYLTLSLLMGLL